MGRWWHLPSLKLTYPASPETRPGPKRKGICLLQAWRLLRIYHGYNLIMWMCSIFFPMNYWETYSKISDLLCLCKTLSTCCLRKSMTWRSVCVLSKSGPSFLFTVKNDFKMNPRFNLRNSKVLEFLKFLDSTIKKNKLHQKHWFLPPPAKVGAICHAKKGLLDIS